MLFARDRDEFNAIDRLLRPYAEQIEPWLLQKESVLGWCRACKGLKTFSVAPGQGADSWRSLLEGMVCTCGLNGRMRLILSVLDEVVRPRDGIRAHVLERLTPLFAPLAERVRELVGSEFLEGPRAGTSVSLGGVKVRCESMMGLSYPASSLDLVMHFDVLEHVPDWKLGLRECARVLRRGGTLLFTCPFFYRMDRNLVRAEWRNGEIVHLMPPGYHGNPVSAQGSLVFYHPSWEVFFELRKVGFRNVRLAINYSVSEGIVSNACPYPDGHVWPVAFVAERGET